MKGKYYKKIFLISLMFFITILPFKSLHAYLIGSYQRIDFTSWRHYPDSVSFQLLYGPYGPNGEDVGTSGYQPTWGNIFDLSVSPANEGDIFTVSSGQAFDVAVQSLTNGIMDSHRIWFYDYTHWGPETDLWLANNVWATGSEQGYYTGQNNIDFEGFKIDSISFRLDTYNNSNVTFTLLVGGVPIPEPSTMVLVISSLIGLFGGRKKLENIFRGRVNISGATNLVMKMFIFFIAIIGFIVFSTGAAYATFKCKGENLYIRQDTVSDVIEKCGEPVHRINVGSANKGNMEIKRGSDGKIKSVRYKGRSEDIEYWTYHCLRRRWTLTFKGGLLINIEQKEKIEGGNRD